MIKFKKLLNLKKSTSNSTVTSYAPLELYIQPSDLDITKKIHKIDYIFDDSTITQKLFYKKTTTDTIPYPDEIGDPRNYIVNKTFYFTTTGYSQTYGVSAHIYEMGVSQPTKIEFNVYLRKPPMDGNVQNAVFQSVELLYTRIFGVNNDILYVFETSNPCYYLPIIVNWTNRPIVENMIGLNSTTKRRAYRILQPFQNKNYENPYTIEFTNKQEEADNDPNFPGCT